MKVRTLLFVSLAVLGMVALPATTARALLVKVSINFGPTATGPTDGTLCDGQPGRHAPHHVGAWHRHQRALSI